MDKKRKMSRKSQVTAFMIIGLVILLMVAAALFIRSIVTEKALGAKVERMSTAPAGLEPLKDFVDDCVEDMAVPGLYLLGVQGGYIYHLSNHIETPYSDVAYGYHSGNITLASTKEMARQLSIYLNANLPSCTANFTSFKALGWDITEGNLTTNITISEDWVLFSINYPLSVNQQGAIRTMDKFEILVPVRLGHMRRMAENITRLVAADPGWVDFTALSDMSTPDIKVNVLPHDSENILYSITDNRSNIDGEIFMFVFAAQIPPNEPPKLMIEDTITVYDEVYFEYKVPYEDDGHVTFSDNHPLFDITSDGWIKFTPEVKGEFDVEITVRDSYGKFDSKVVKFIVLEPEAEPVLETGVDN